MSEQETSGGTPNTAKSTKETTSILESRYIQLLESKITHLESQLEAQMSEAGPIAQYGDLHDSSVVEAPALINVTDSTLEEQGLVPEAKESRYQLIRSEWDPRTGEFSVQPLSGLKEETTIGLFNQCRAFTFRKITGMHRYSRMRAYDDISSSSEVDVVFQPLRKLLGRITSKWGWPDEVSKCASPYMPLIRSWKEAQEESTMIRAEDSEDDKQARDDLKELLRIISTSSGDVRLDRYFKNRQAFESECTITHDALWTLFPPGTLIVGRPCHDEQQVFVVNECSGFVSDEQKFALRCFSFDWNGLRFSRVPFEMMIEGWGGDRKSVTSLPFYPLEFYKEDGLTSEESVEKLKKRLIKRGEMYVRLCQAEKGKQMFNHMEGQAYFRRGGVFLQHKETDPGLDSSSEPRGSSSTNSDYADASAAFLGAGWKPPGVSSRRLSSDVVNNARWEQVEGEVIVDFASYLSYQSADTPILGSLRRFDEGMAAPPSERRGEETFKNMYRLEWDAHKPKTKISPEQFLCCPPRVLGYALKRKAWAQLLVRHLKDPNSADEKTFDDKLQLDKEPKDLIWKSVKAHSDSRRREKGESTKGLDDFAPEKGRGLVIMLYGEPGVGKTLTAESVAQKVGKPLFSIGVSDIGIDGDKVETNLQKVFALAGLWEAVLLFDEADVFLESRGEGDNDLRRNAMVSVLLRVLEYYEGILVLTTNRMRSLDIAVQSRIHLAIKFTELSPAQKYNIFLSFLEQLSNKNLVENFQDLEKWVDKEGKKYNFNGRQIRNVISTALGIARASGEKLNREYLTDVARQTDQFKRELADQEAIYRDRHISQRS